MYLICFRLCLTVEHPQGTHRQRPHLLLAGKPQDGGQPPHIGGDIVTEKLLIGHATGVDAMASTSKCSTAAMAPMSLASWYTSAR